MALNFKLRFLLWYLALTERKKLEDYPAAIARERSEKAQLKAAKLLDSQTPMHDVSNETIQYQGIDVPFRIYKPLEENNLPILMYFHGGGFVIGSLDTHDNICRRLAKDSKCIVISVDYPLGPEHKFPIAPNACYITTKWAFEHAADFGGDASRIAVGGDSAGGNLAAVVCLMAKEHKEFSICHQMLIYPAVDATMSFPSIKKNGEGYILTESLMSWFIDHYTNEDTDRKDPYLSPFYAKDLSDLPSATVITAQYDPLVDEGNAYADKLRTAGVEVNHKEFPSVIHTFWVMHKFLPATRQAFEMATDDLRKAFERKIEVVS